MSDDGDSVESGSWAIDVLRTIRSYSRKEAAEKLGLSQSQVRRIQEELSTPRKATLAKLQKCLEARSLSHIRLVGQERALELLCEHGLLPERVIRLLRQHGLASG